MIDLGRQNQVGPALKGTTKEITVKGFRIDIVRGRDELLVVFADVLLEIIEREHIFDRVLEY